MAATLVLRSLSDEPDRKYHRIVAFGLAHDVITGRETRVVATVADDDEDFAIACGVRGQILLRETQGIPERRAADRVRTQDAVLDAARIARQRDVDVRLVVEV